jgi:hypothetical protein
VMKCAPFATSDRAAASESPPIRDRIPKEINVHCKRVGVPGAFPNSFV